MNSRHLHIVAAIISLYLPLAGCVAVDSRAWKEPVDKQATKNITGRYLNHASYRSEKMGLFGAATFLELINYYPSPTPDIVVLSFSESNGLTIGLDDGSRKVDLKTYGSADGLKIDSDGKLRLFSESSCGLIHSGKFYPGCDSKTVTLFVNPDGDLVTVQSWGSGGVNSFIPGYEHVELVAIFPKEPKDFIRSQNAAANELKE